MPVGGWHDLVIGVDSLLVESAVSRPADALVCHGIGGGSVLTLRSQIGGLEDCVVENTVGYESTWIDGLPVGATCLEGITSAIGYCAVRAKLSFQLVLIQTLYISPVVLIEVCESVVEEDGRLDLAWDIEL